MNVYFASHCEVTDDELEIILFKFVFSFESEKYPEWNSILEQCPFSIKKQVTFVA